MGTGKKEASRKERQGKTNDGMANVKIKGENFYRDAKKVRVLKRLTDGKPTRNAAGKITQSASYQSRDKPKARVEPHRKWFTNSRVISQETLSSFREAIEQQTADPNSYLLKSNKLPMSLIRDDETKTKNGVRIYQAKMVVGASSFKDTFGPKAQRKKVKLGLSSFEDLAGETVKQHDTFLDRQEQAKLLTGQLGAYTDLNENDKDEATGVLSAARESIFSKGQSKRIWNELYKVIDSSDVVVHVLDARDPVGTRCRAIEQYLEKEAPHKHLVFILNKCDLVPTGVAATWVRLLSKEHPTLAFHASITNSFGKGSLIALLRQFAILHQDRKQVSVGFVGYPNTGKSSIINTLRKKVVCKTAPIPGETKVWQYITLTRRIYLIDCPGIVPPNPNDTDCQILLRGVVRVENVENPSQYVAVMLSLCQTRHVERTYGIKGWNSDDEFLEMLARKSGRLLKGGEADLNSVARMVLNDFLRGRVPWFIPPPKGDDAKVEGMEGREGRLGEMKTGTKRKRDEADSQPKAPGIAEDDFEGFEDESENGQESAGEDDSLEITTQSSQQDDSDDPPDELDDDELENDELDPQSDQ
ncbi:putative nucleolar GTPase [Microthyrium microscopicum]|uniref:Nucleolar GTP-binding protein 2 n=1 Tax=Microthyrium microscopicum TaxID=703497 RepID=A0A6A6TZ53_9PEZI|nr:putative nucleolar GTPase [Microthyrium microscopicum]